MEKVFIGIFYKTVVLTRAKKREDATVILRKALDASDLDEAAPISLMNHVALVYWSEKRKAHWYRLPSSPEACAIHPERVPKDLLPLVPKKEPDRIAWTEETSAGDPP